MAQDKTDRQKAAEIVRDAGGRIVGRTRLQKVAFLLELAGLGGGFPFEYKHYGPYSEELAAAICTAAVFGLVHVEEKETSWGGWYSIYAITDKIGEVVSKQRATLANAAANIGSVELELAATAAYLSVVESYKDPWEETVRRKPEKAAQGRIEKAKIAYQMLMQFETPNSLPKIV